MAATYIVFAPPYTDKSAGVMCLWRLAETINKIGRQALVINCEIVNGNFIISLDGKEWIPCNENTIREMISPLHNPVVIHGENLDCKYFKGANVARYYLNKMGVLLNKGNASEGEYKVAFDKLFCDPYDYLLPQYTGKISLEIARGLQFMPRNLDLTYIGKGHIYHAVTPVVSGTVCLTRTWPDSADQYLKLLENTRFLYSYDSITSVLLDAVLMGAAPILLSWEPLGEKVMRSNVDDAFPLYTIDSFGREAFDFEKFVVQRNIYIDKCLRNHVGLDLSVKSMCLDIERFFKISSHQCQ